MHICNRANTDQFWYVEYNIFITKMADNEILNFCNQYLISKVLLSDPKQINANSLKQKNGRNPKGNKRSKFEKPRTKKADEQPQLSLTPNKTKKKKIQGQRKQKPIITQQEPENVNEDDGFVSINTLLNQLAGNSQANTYATSKTHFNSKSTANFREEPHPELSKFAPYHKQKSYQRDFRQYPQSRIEASPIRAHNISQYVYESPQRQRKQQKLMYIPVSRNHSQSNLNLNLSASAIRGSGNETERKKKGERSFYMPTSVSQKKLEDQEDARSQNNLSSNSFILAKFQKELIEQQRQMALSTSAVKKSKASETRYETNIAKGRGDNKDRDRGSDRDDYSQFQLDTRVRQSLTYLSQARVPPKPITVEIKKIQ